MTGIKGENITFVTCIASTVNVTDISYQWHQNGERLLEGYTGSTATINFNDLLDSSGKLPSHSMTSLTEGDLGSTYISCLVQFKYKNVEYYIYSDFYVAGYSSVLESQINVRTNTTGYSVNYHECFEFSDPLCEVEVTAPSDSQVSYKWYKVDSLNPDINAVYKNESLYVELTGFNTNELWMSQSLLDKIGEACIEKIDVEKIEEYYAKGLDEA